MSNTLEIKLLGKDYRVACKPEEREGLLAAVALLDGKLTEAGDKAKGNGERVAVMVALNLAHELLVAKDTPEQRAMALEQEAIQRRINSIEAKLDESLALHQQLF
jgi:cell division protein ZapA